MLRAAEQIGRVEATKLQADRKLWGPLKDRLAGKCQITNTPVATCDACQVSILRVINSDRSIKSQSIVQCRRRQTDLSPSAPRPDRTNATGGRSDALAKGKIIVVTLKNASLKTAEVFAKKCFPKNADAV